MFNRNSKARVFARTWLEKHLGARGWYMMFKSREFRRELLNVRKWTFLTRFMPYTLVVYPDLSGLYDMITAVEQQAIPGVFVECGVWRGGCAALMASRAAKTGRQTHLFDSFEGLPEPIEIDGRRALKKSAGKADGQLKALGDLAVSIEQVKSVLFDHFRLDEKNIVFHKGWFQDVLPVVHDSLGPIAILRLDGDWYESTRVCLQYLYDHVSQGGYVVIDDYNYFEGCRKATDEFLQERGLVDALHIGPCVYFRKPVKAPHPEVETQAPETV